MIISRYLTKETLQTLCAVTLVLLLIFLSNQLVRLMNYAASGKIATGILLKLMGFQIFYLLGILLPLGLYLGIILTYSRLYADNEMRVMHAYGLSAKKLMMITGSIAAGVTVIVVVLMLWVNPWIAEQKTQLLTQSDNLFDTLMPGRFQVTSDGKRVVYVEKMTRNRRQVNNVFIADQKDTREEEGDNRWAVLSAAKGYQEKDPQTQSRFVVAIEGNRYDGVPGQNDYQILQFKKYAVRLPESLTSSRREELEAVPTTTLFTTSNTPERAAELQWRISIPLSALLLAFLAIPFSYVRPRQGRYVMLLPAVIIYMVYMNFLFVGRNLLEQKIIPPFIGMWWVHLLMCALLGSIFFLQSVWRMRH